MSAPRETDRFVEILGRLEREFPLTPSLLDYRTPFELLIGVILSAQTTDQQVNAILPELFASYPDADTLASADPASVEAIVHPVGFFRVKARNIIGAARSIRDRFGGAIPDSMEELISIPGVGRKSAGVLLLHVFDKPAIIVDTHFARVTRRLGFTKSTQPAHVERDVAGTLPSSHWNSASMRLNYHGRRTCTARKPACPRCVLSDICPSAGENGP